VASCSEIVNSLANAEVISENVFFLEFDGQAELQFLQGLYSY
jgi:hypothetical protein